MRKRISMTALAWCALGPLPASAVLAQSHAARNPAATPYSASDTRPVLERLPDLQPENLPPAVAVAVQAPAAPQAPGAPGLSKGEIKAMRDFKLLDFNGDGQLSRTEVKLFPRLSNAFDDADTNGDNYVSYAEVQAFAVKYRAERDRQRAAAAQESPPPADGATPAQ